ncbi:MAG: hypothetical protein WC373_12630 [Smithella sp.]
MIVREYDRGVSMQCIARAASVHPDNVCRLAKSLGLVLKRGGTSQSVMSARAAVRKLKADILETRKAELPDISGINIYPDRSPCINCKRYKLMKSRCFDVCPAIEKFQELQRVRVVRARYDYDAIKDHAIRY